MLNIKAALSDNWVIGNEGKSPWHSKEDMRRFRKTTLGQRLVMGRKTYESVGALDQRSILVLSRTDCYEVQILGGVPIRLATIESGGLNIERFVEKWSSAPAPPLYICGGSEVYEQFLPHADRMELTRVHIDVEGDALFPSFQEGRYGWRITESEHYNDEGLLLTFETWERNRVVVEVTW
jgi:dihydrofolate reductase